MKKINILLVHLFFLTFNCFPQLTFNKWFFSPGPGSSQYSYARETKDKGYFFGGSAYTTSTTVTDAFVLKMDKNGNEQWRKTFGGVYHDYIKDVISLDDKGYLAIGYTNSITFSYQSYFTKFDSIGNILWIKSLSPNSIEPRRGYQTKEGGLLFLGYNAFYNYPIVIKTDAQCNFKWSLYPHIYGGNVKYFSYSITPTLDNGVFLTATCDTNPTYDRKRIFCIKFDSLGNVNWSKLYYNSYSPTIQNVIQQSDSTYLLVGTNDTLGLGKKDMCLFKLNSNGTLIWSKTIGNIMSEYGSDVLQAANNEIIVVGRVDSLNNNDSDGIFVKLDQNGNVINASTIGISGKYDELMAIAPAVNTEYILTGRSDYKMNLYKLNSNLQLGCTELTASINAINLPMNTAMFPSYLYSVAINVSAITLNPLPDFGNLSDRCTNINVLEYEKNTNFSVYPNPALNIVNIETQQSELENLEIEITNILGQTILKLPYVKTIDVSRLEQGLYTLKISTLNEQVYYSKFAKE